MKKGVRKQGLCEVCGISFYKYRKCLKFCSWECSAKRRELKIDQIYLDKLKKKIFENSDVDLITGCWNWKKYKDKDGRAYCYFKKRTIPAARVSYMSVYGEVFDKNIFICHKCDNYSCVNPDHLFAGTHQDNMNDRDQKKEMQKAKK